MKWMKRLIAVGAGALVATCGQALAQPANNACSSAINLIVPTNGSVSINGTTVASTFDGGTGNCGSSGATGDVWYTVTAPATGQLTADTCTAFSYDTVVGFRTSAACPGAAITSGCNDDSCGNGSSVTIPVTAGTVYRIRVSGFNGATGTFTLKVTHSPPPAPPAPSIGPDVITATVYDISRYGTDATGTITAYAVGTESNNPGDYPVLWIDNTNYAPDFDTTQHPIIGQNIFRLKSYGAYSRFEHLGQGWLKHGFVSTNSSCTVANGDRLWRYSTQAYQSVGGDVLAISCFDIYSSSLNGSQSGLGAKNIVNSTLGTSPFVKGNATGDATARARIQVPTADVTGQPAGTRFYAEGQYIAADDAQFVRPSSTVAINGLNNASWREITASTINNAAPSFASTTNREQPAIFAWKAADPTVVLVSADHDDFPNPCTGYKAPDGSPQYPAGTTTVRSRFWIACKATSLGGGLWRYEYAVHNLNSDRAGESFSLPFPDSAATPTDVTFHAPQYHSGEPYSNAAWTFAKGGNKLTWSTTPYATNVNASALRWGTLYNFGFTTDVAPTTGDGTIKLFKPGTAGSPTEVVATNITVPTLPAPTGCNVADITEIGGTAETPGTPDNQLTVDDIIVFINLFSDATGCPGAAPCSRADVTGLGGAGAAPDGQLTVDDVIEFFNAFSDGCP